MTATGKDGMAQRSLMIVASLLVAIFCATTVTAQTSGELKAQANRYTIGVISGGIDGTYIRIAADLSAVLEEPKSLRILPVLGKGSVQNLSDLLYLRGIDVGIVQSDVLAYVKREKTYPGIENRLQYISKLYNEELHILGGRGINSIADLAGKKVNFDVKGSGTFITGTLVFDALKVEVEPVAYDQALALEMVKKGEIAALAYVSGKPARLFANLKPEDDVRFLAVPLNAELLQTYLPSQLTHDDYAFLSAPVETVAVGAVMAVVSFPPQSERYRNLARFTEAFFSKFAAFREPPRHPKWREVSLSAELPGWTRFAPAQTWLANNARPSTPIPAAEVRKAFDALLDQQAKSTGRTISAQQRAALFQQFLQWGQQ
jgi:TRAP transporter TAXI family solute receptor